MNKQLSASMISLSLGIWLVAVYNFSGQSNFQTKQTSNFSYLENFDGLDFYIFELENHPKGSGVKVDWSQKRKLNLEIGNFAKLSSRICLKKLFPKTLDTLFDIKIIFLHFFYPY